MGVAMDFWIGGGLFHAPTNLPQRVTNALPRSCCATALFFMFTRGAHVDGECATLHALQYVLQHHMVPNDWRNQK